MIIRNFVLASIFLGICFSSTAQRIGPDVKRELPKTLYISGATDSLFSKVAEYFNEEKRSFKLEYLAPDELFKKLVDEKAAFILPFKNTKNGAKDYSLAIVSGSKKAKLNAINEDGVFSWDFNLPLVVEVHAEYEWLTSEMVLLYASALERFHVQGQTMNQAQLRSQMEELISGKYNRILVLENSVIDPLRAEGKLASVIGGAQAYSSTAELLKSENIFNPTTVVYTAFEFAGKRVQAVYSFTSGMRLFKEDALSEKNGSQVGFAEIKTVFKGY